ncbi:DUF397 domain-containing protein [Streptomyces sp. SAS_270]|uniref:DUF397 domain-containing protein n=1 Tax=Streptomyces sp. SAS_270 TaxID=3412748 RepID=UPI00403D3AA4
MWRPTAGGLRSGRGTGLRVAVGDSSGSACVEVAPCPHAVHVRDSKLGDRSPQFSVPGDAWAAFITYATGA